MTSTGKNRSTLLFVGALVLTLLVGIATPITAGSMFGNRSRDKQDKVEKSSSSSRSSTATSPSKDGIARTDTKSPRDRAPADAGLGNIRNRSRNDKSSSRQSGSYSSQSRDGIKGRDSGTTTRTSDLSRERDNRSRSYSGSNTDRSRFYDRVEERGQVRAHHDRQYYTTYRNYYEGSLYRPYAGWLDPHYDSGRYYYSWPVRIEPCYFGYYVFGHEPDYSCRSVYYYYGYFPYIHRSRVVVISVPVVTYVEVQVRGNYRDSYDDDYYLSRPSRGTIDWALRDVRNAWLRNDLDSIDQYIDRDKRINVYIDGRYTYSVEGRDYVEMTRDALERMDTIDIDFYSIKRHGDDRYIAYGEHTYRDADGDRKTAYISYTFEKVHGDWTIAEVGSSKSRFGR